jgi:hypothetical protein
MDEETKEDVKIILAVAGAVSAIYGTVYVVFKWQDRKYIKRVQRSTDEMIERMDKTVAKIQNDFPQKF